MLKSLLLVSVELFPTCSHMPNYPAKVAKSFQRTIIRQAYFVEHSTRFMNKTIWESSRTIYIRYGRRRKSEEENTRDAISCLCI